MCDCKLLLLNELLHTNALETTWLSNFVLGEILDFDSCLPMVNLISLPAFGYNAGYNITGISGIPLIPNGRLLRFQGGLQPANLD